MPVVVRVVEPAEFESWLAGQKAARQAAAQPPSPASEPAAPSDPAAAPAATVTDTPEYPAQPVLVADAE
jgi:heme/copper-type cytochrome/quinol oxidase subunit 2